MASSRPPPSKSVDLDLTIVSAKHLKNVNWKNGDLKPYVVFWVDPERRLATKSDDSGNTSPVWNERFALPLPLPLHDSFLTLEIFHSKPSDTPKPLVATLRLPLKDLHDSTRLRKFPLSRPSAALTARSTSNSASSAAPNSITPPSTLTLTLISSATEDTPLPIPLLHQPLLTHHTPLTLTPILITTPLTILALLPLPPLDPSSTVTLGPVGLLLRLITPPLMTPCPSLPKWASALASPLALLLGLSAGLLSTRALTTKRTRSPRGSRTTSLLLRATITAITEWIIELSLLPVLS
ncbi:hypothetical protein AAZX31_11G231000 [Glycine max]|nr:hypothetical protein JHK85_032773 [Glycine max]